MSTIQTVFDPAYHGLLREVARDNNGVEVNAGDSQGKYVIGDRGDARRHVLSTAGNRNDLRYNNRYEASGLTWSGGGATKAFTVTGALVSAADGLPEVAFAELVFAGATPRKVVSAIVTSNDTVTVTLDGANVGNDVIINLSVFKL